MRSEAEVWQALRCRKGLSVSDLARDLGITRDHADELLTGTPASESQWEAVEGALALGTPTGGDPLYAIGELDESGELDVVPAGDAQPLFASRDVAARVAQELEAVCHSVCVVPVWPTYAWRNLVSFHAAWGAEPEPRKLFVVDSATDEVPLKTVLEEIRYGLEATLRGRAQAHDPALLEEVNSRLSGYTDARFPQ
jgi:hypothetical protein